MLLYVPKSAGRRGAYKTRNKLQDETLKTLQVLISKQEIEDECERIATDWRQVAKVIDRLLFWVFFVATVGISLIVLFVIPLIRQSLDSETDKLDERLYGLIY